TFTLERKTYMDNRLAMFAAISFDKNSAKRSSEELLCGDNISQALASILPLGLQYPTSLTAEDGAITDEGVRANPRTEFVS
ncbi:MAG: hypothetical protein RI975_801, partial [Pseudomonadota bacterium]